MIWHHNNECIFVISTSKHFQETNSNAAYFIVMKNKSFEIIMYRGCHGEHTYFQRAHYSDVIMSTIASQITSVSIACSTVCSGTDQWKHQSSASLAFVGGIHRWPVNSPHKRPVMRKMFPFYDAIMTNYAKIWPFSMRHCNIVSYL